MSSPDALLISESVVAPRGHDLDRAAGRLGAATARTATESHADS